MKFTLVEAEIKEAISDYLKKVITVNEGATIEIDLKATRGADGVTAEVDVALAGGLTVKPAVVAEPVLAPVAPAVKPPVVATPPAEPVHEQLATATAPELDEQEEADPAAEAGQEGEVQGKSIFG